MVLLQGAMKHIPIDLQRMIDYRDVSDGIVAWNRMQELL